MIPTFTKALRDSTYGLLIVVVPFAMFVYALAAFLPSRYTFGGPIAFALLFGMYIVHSLTLTLPPLETLQPFLLFEYYNADRLADNGIPLLDLAIMTGTALAFGGLAWWQIDRKELGV